MVLELKEADPGQVESLWVANFASWGPPLDMQTYIARERRLTEILSTDGEVTFWILVDSSSSTPLCACETSKKRGLVKSPGKEINEVPVIVVALVFTPAQNRGKGYAGKMMRLLSERIRNSADGRGFSVLYSDIGPDFYTKNGGWNVYDADEIMIPKTMEFLSTSKVEMLTLQQAKACIDEDVALLKKDFVEETETTIIQMIPQYAELEWATFRDKCTAQYLNLEVSEFVGAKATSAEGWGYILWFNDYEDSSLTVLRLREPPTDGELIGLIGAAMSEARRSGVEHVAIWSPSERLENVTGVMKIARKEALPGLLYFGDEDNICWRNIEKLGWC